jgi:hypothetical protein
MYPCVNDACSHGFVVRLSISFQWFTINNNEKKILDNRVALYIVDQTLQGERGSHDQQLIPQQYACKSTTQNFMALL